LKFEKNLINGHVGILKSEEARFVFRKQLNGYSFPSTHTLYLLDAFMDCVFFLLCKGRANGLRYPRWGGRTVTPSAWKNDKARKLLEISPDSPASGARFVGWRPMIIYSPKGDFYLPKASLCSQEYLVLSEPVRIRA